MCTRTTVGDDRKFTVIYRSRIARQQSLSFIHRSLNFPQEIRIWAFQNSNKCLSDPDSLVYITRRSSLNVQVYSKFADRWPFDKNYSHYSCTIQSTRCMPKVSLNTSKFLSRCNFELLKNERILMRDQRFNRNCHRISYLSKRRWLRPWPWPRQSVT